MSYTGKVEQIRNELIHNELAKIKHCTVCDYFDIWQEIPDDATCVEDCIPHHYCNYHHYAIDDKETCEHFK